MAQKGQGGRAAQIERPEVPDGSDRKAKGAGWLRSRGSSDRKARGAGDSDSHIRGHEKAQSSTAKAPGQLQCIQRGYQRSSA